MGRSYDTEKIREIMLTPSSTENKIEDLAHLIAEQIVEIRWDIHELLHELKNR